MKFLAPVLLVLLLAVSACDVGAGAPDIGDVESSMATHAALTIESSTAGEDTYWSQMSAADLWTHIAGLDSTVSVGLKQPGQRRGVDKRGRSLVPKSKWRGFSNRVAALGADLLSLDDLHPLATLRLEGADQIEALRRSPFVEFVEPASFDPTGVLMNGCGSSDARQLGRTTSPGDVVPYTLQRHKIDEAWQFSTGVGVTIGVVDTGVSVYQPQLRERFTAGQSGGRTITYDYTDANHNGAPYWQDTYGHGTKILGLATAPRDGQNIVGVAYGANAYAVRAVDDPATGPGQWGEIREGINRAASNSDIVNMAFGWTWGDSGVANTIRYYYYHKDYERLFIGAAGSAQWVGGVKWPAEMPEVIAVTGTFGGTTPCEGCAYGDVVEFAAYTAGETTGSNNNGVSDKNAAGKSSGATAIVSGIAALIWSKYPNWSRDQVLQRMREASRYTNDRVRDDKIGHGTIDAFRALGGLTSAHLGGPSPVYSSGTYAYEIYPKGGTPPFTYQWSTGDQWSTGETTKTIMLPVETLSEDYTITLGGSVTDANGTTRSVYLSVLVYSNFGLGTGGPGEGGPGTGGLGTG